MTKRLRRVTKAKKATYFDRGTCQRCRTSYVLHPSGLCRHCRPIVQDELVDAAMEALENEKATVFFRYYLTCRKKDASDIGRLARTFLSTPGFRELKGLQAIAEGTPPDLVDVQVLERAWEASELERASSGDR